MTSRYDVPVDPEATNNPHSAAIRLVGTGKRVLELGCAGGHVTRHLIERGNTVVGVELDPDAAEAARRFCDDVVVADLEQTRPSELVAGTFDVVLMGDVLEHLRDPEATLRDAVDLLNEDGIVVLSLPNVAHIDVRAMLLLGEWNYQDVGLLDRTHLRWFTRRSVRELLDSVGLVATEVERVRINFTTSGIAVRDDIIAPVIKHVIDADPEAETFQWVVSARRAAPGLADALAEPAMPDEVEWPNLDAEHQQVVAELEAERDALAERCDALANEVDAWRRSRIIRYSAPLRAAARRGRHLARRLPVGR